MNGLIRFVEERPGLSAALLFLGLGLVFFAAVLLPPAGQVLGGKLSALTAVRSARLMIYELTGFYGIKPILHPAAAVSVDAHLRKLDRDGLVSYHGGGWLGEVEPR